MNELIKITVNGRQEPCISGRELHGFLEVKEKYTQWFQRMADYGFTENLDFATVSEKTEIANGGFQERFNHIIKLDMAKELAMIQRTEKGKQARQYFIAVEKEYNSPEKIMARALHIAQKELSTLRLENDKMKPKALFADAVSASDTTILIGELAKILKGNGVDIGQKRLFAWLRDNSYLIRRQGSDRNTPTQKAMEMGLFKVKETVVTHPDGHTSITKTTKVT